MTWAVLIGVIYYFQWKLADAEEQEFVGATPRTDDFELAQPMGQMQQYMDRQEAAVLQKAATLEEMGVDEYLAGMQ